MYGSLREELEFRLGELARLTKQLFGVDLSELLYDTLYIARCFYKKKGKSYAYAYLYGERNKKKHRIAKLRGVDEKIRYVISLYRSCKLLQKALYYEERGLSPSKTTIHGGLCSPQKSKNRG